MHAATIQLLVYNRENKTTIKHQDLNLQFTFMTHP